MTFMHVVYTYQSRNQRYLLRKKINYLIEKYKHNKDVQKLKLEVEELRKLRTSQIQEINQNRIEKASETFVTAEMDDTTAEMDNGTADAGTTDVQALVEQDSAPLVVLESEELIAADVEIVLNTALDNIEKEMINMCEAEIQVDVTDFVENDELVGLGEFEIVILISFSLSGIYIPKPVGPKLFGKTRTRPDHRKFSKSRTNSDPRTRKMSNDHQRIVFQTVIR